MWAVERCRLPRARTATVPARGVMQGKWVALRVYRPGLLSESNGTPEDVNFHLCRHSRRHEPCGRRFAFAGQPTVSELHAKHSLYTYAPGSVQATRTSTGVYTITFAGLASAAGGLARVSAYDTTTTSLNYCHVTSSAASGADFVAQVSCFSGVTGVPTDSRSEILIIPPPLSLICVPSAGPAATNTAYSSTCTAIGGVSPYTFSTTQTLPAGLSLSSTNTTATISGTPAASAAGSYSYGVVVTDAQKESLTASYQGTISASGSGGGSLSLTCSPTSGPANLGVAYSSTCTASGGAPPYSFVVKPGLLPAGLSLQAASTPATISGIPTTAGAYSYGVTVQNKKSPVQSATVNFSGTIAAASSSGSPPKILTNGIVSSASFYACPGAERSDSRRAEFFPSSAITLARQLPRSNHHSRAPTRSRAFPFR